MDRSPVRWFAPVAVAGLVMLPRLASPQFGLLDDGLTLQTGREVIGRWSISLHLIPETGRFFPAYWLVYSAILGVGGVSPLAFFTVNVLLLAGLLTVLARLVRWGGGTSLQAAVAAVLFALCGPTIESFYTLSKAEPLQLTWIGVSLLTTAASAIDTQRMRRVMLIALAAAAVLLAHATKETSVVLIPIALGWLAIESWWCRERAPWARFARTYVVITVVAAAAFGALRWYYAPLGLAQGTYTRAYALHREARQRFRVPPATADRRRRLLGRWPTGVSSTDPLRVRLDRGLARRLRAVAGNVRVLLVTVCVRGRGARRYRRRRRLGLAKAPAFGDGTTRGVVRPRGEWIAVADGDRQCDLGRAGSACRGPRQRRPGRFPGRPAEPQSRRREHEGE